MCFSIYYKLENTQLREYVNIASCSHAHGHRPLLRKQANIVDHWLSLETVAILVETVCIF